MMHLNVVTLVLAGVLGCVSIWLVAKSTKTWLIVAILSHLILFLHRHAVEETSVYQAAAYSLLFFPGLFWWFVKRFMESGKIIEHWAELALVIFLSFAFLSVGWATLYGFSAAKGIREFALFIPYLMYFPLRDYVAEKGEKVVLAALLLVCMTVAVYDIVQYRLSMAAAQYFWQVIGRRENLGEPLMMSSILIFFGFIASRQYNMLLVLALIAISSIALVLTFSRGYWGATFLGLVLFTFVLRGSPRRRILTVGILSVLAVSAVAALVFPKILVDLVEGIGARLARIGFNDLSLQSRISESAAVLNHFQRSPVIGYGMGAEFSFFNPITYLTATTWYVHNGYLFLLYKFGIIGAVLYLCFYGHMLISTVREASRNPDENKKVFLYSLTCIMASMLAVNFTSPQFYDRVSILILVLLWGISSGISKKNLTLNEASEPA